MSKYPLTSIFLTHIKNKNYSLSVFNNYIKNNSNIPKQPHLTYKDYFRMASDHFKAYLITGVAVNDIIYGVDGRRGVAYRIFEGLVELDREFLEFDRKNPYDYSDENTDDYVDIENDTDSKDI